VRTEFNASAACTCWLPSICITPELDTACITA
jgi:hypothetical protein